MLPIVFLFKFETPLSQLVLVLIALLGVLYVAWSAWRGASSPKDRLPRAALFGVGAAGLAIWGLKYALPQMPLLGPGKGEGLPIHTYGLFVGGGFLAAVTVAGWHAQREWLGAEGKRKREQIFDLAFWVFLGALVGARVLFILVNFNEFLRNPSPIGGLVFYGGLIGATIAAMLYARANDIDFLRLADVAIPTVSLGQCLGRLGCFAAGCCWGRVTPAASAWGMRFPGQQTKDLLGGVTGTPSLAYSSMAQDGRYVVEQTGELLHSLTPGAVQVSEWVRTHGHTLPVHPTQLYESIGSLLLFGVFVVLRRYRRFHGQVFGLWLMSYALLRSTIELFRGDTERGTLHALLREAFGAELAAAVPLEAWYNVSTSQFISLALFSVGAFVLVRQGRAFVARRRTTLTGPLAA